MQTKLKIIVAAVMLGTATLAGAQAPSRAQTFASQFSSMQTLSANTASTYAYKPTPALSKTAQDPVAMESLGDRYADLQAQSSNSSNFEPAPTLTRIAADPVGHEPFADAYALMQAASSNSGEYGFRPGSDAPAALANNTTVQGKRLTRIAQTPVETAMPTNVASQK